MKHTIRNLLLVLGGFIIFSQNAEAKKVVVPPMLPRGVSAQQATNMTTLLSSELEFMGEFDEVAQLTKRPSQLGSSCLTSSSCLKGIASANGSQAVVAGKVTKYGGDVELVIVYLDDGKIIRTVKKKVTNDAMAIADEMSVLVRHVITGVDPDAKAAADKISGFEGGGMALMDEEDEDEDDSMLASSASVSRRIERPSGSADDDLDFEEFDEDLDEEDDDRNGGRAAAAGAGAAAVIAARRMAEQNTAAQARDQARKAAAAAAMDARRKAAVEAAKRAAKAQATAEAARKAAEMEVAAAAAAAAKLAEPVPEFDPNEFNFGGSAEDISFGSASSMIEVDEVEEESYGNSSSGYLDLDGPEPSKSRTPTRDTRSRSTSPRSRNTTSASSGGIEVTGRLGYGRFQYLSFMTYGFEAAYQLQDNIAVVGGLEAFSTRRLLPPDQVPVGQPAVQWNTILPLSVGALYRPMNDTIRPYVGANIQLLPGYVAEAGSMAFGLQARGGLDYLLADNIGINVNAGAGFWAGSEWYRIEGLLNTGMTAQINVGTVFLF
jgi:hypothetical protein